MKKTLVVCDQCGEPCGTGESSWYYINATVVMAETTTAMPPFGKFDGGDFCSTQCLWTYVDDLF